MKSLVWITVAAALAIGISLQAQDAVEYHSTGVKAAPSPGITIPSKIGTALDKAASGKSEAAATSPGAKLQTIDIPNHPAKAATAPVPPPPPAIFVLSNGEKIETSRYILTTDSLRIEQTGAERTIPLTALNMAATKDVNQKRGVTLLFPSSKSQMVLSF